MEFSVSLKPANPTEWADFTILGHRLRRHCRRRGHLRFIDFVRMLIAAAGENPLLALVRLIDGNHRRYGGQLVHMGILSVVIGVTGSSVFSSNQTVPNESRPFRRTLPASS